VIHVEWHNPTVQAALISAGAAIIGALLQWITRSSAQGRRKKGHSR
jgi:hypothetical protein